MSPGQSELVERLRALLAGKAVVREVFMFGGWSFMVNERLVVSALKDGGLLVRVDASRHDELLARPGASQAQMGAGRSMGPGWLEVGASALGGPPGTVFLAGAGARAQQGARRARAVDEARAVSAAGDRALAARGR
ncbi:TfoX/Sxy family protein [Actinomyces sp. 2119]|uniref:TfoX/Sxy family protein n=1 Tax=Actinomyces sp. 2119 TaxID=2321393 RepID=UPI0021756F84|nr:TfoX/Sxy family protein [Actinomyces sp. 2119]